MSTKRALQPEDVSRKLPGHYERLGIFDFSALVSLELLYVLASKVIG